MTQTQPQFPRPPASASGAISIEERLRTALADVLALDPQVARELEVDSALFGAIPELDSMAVAGLLTEIEDRFDIVIDDDEIDADIFVTFGALTDFVAMKAAA